MTDKGTYNYSMSRLGLIKDPVIDREFKLTSQLRKAIDLGEVLCQNNALYSDDIDIMVENCKLLNDPRQSFFEQCSTDIATGIRKYKTF